MRMHHYMGVVGPCRRFWVSVSRYLKLLGREIIFEVFQPVFEKTWSATQKTQKVMFFGI